MDSLKLEPSQLEPRDTKKVEKTQVLNNTKTNGKEYPSKIFATLTKPQPLIKLWNLISTCHLEKDNLLLFLQQKI